MNVINAVAQFERDLLIERIRPDSPAPKPRANRSGGDRHCHPINNHLPVETKKQRKAAHDFRMFLLDEGFEMGQFSNYLRFCAGKEQFNAYSRRIETNLPDPGNPSGVVGDQVAVLQALREERRNWRRFTMKRSGVEISIVR